MADKVVFWRYGDKSDYWHLYPDCKELHGAVLDGTLRKGKPEVAINTGREKVCPVCKARSDREYWQEQKKKPEQGDSAVYWRTDIKTDNQIHKTAQCSALKYANGVHRGTVDEGRNAGHWEKCPLCWSNEQQNVVPTQAVAQQSAIPKPPKMIQQDTAIFYMVLAAALSGVVCWIAASARAENQEPNLDGYVTEHYLKLQKQASYEEGYEAGKAAAQGTASVTAPQHTQSADSTPTSSAMSGKFKVTATASMVYNNHVGNDWWYYFEAGDKQLPATVNCSVGDDVSLYAKITEDDSIPDVGCWDGYVTIEDGDFETGFTVTEDVYVYETSGRYSGNEAKFEVTWDFEPQ